MSTTTEPQLATPTPLEQYTSYPFGTDEIYQQGLASILANADAPSSEEKDEILRRTRVFYFNKTMGHSITLDEAREYEQSLRKDTSSQPQSLSTPSQETAAVDPIPSSDGTQTEEEPRVLTFSELKELIETGRLDQIPNNKVIPSGLNEVPPSDSTAQSRKKPWEVASQALDPNSDAFLTGVAHEI
ncbi:hypothetical protein NP233_g9111 [Leucocoprinus birnbaumii]|uniref:Uncharacterized protein n=1 Tax=Leucocoprinus birnbaumii TaxID=56174 RepID=A0AAD5VKZ8_9AGAR|nr:hypothetical protein NP233_g9111 [Leucocoprinus birnbaumii]